VGTPIAGGTAVLICPDIWGWNSGRTRRFADLLVNDVGISYVVIPKLLSPPFEGGTDGDALPPGFDLIARGSEAWPWLRDFKYETCLHPRLIALVDHLKNNLGISKIGGMGVCYGGWVIAHLTMHCPDISCCVIPHPSIHVEDSLHQGKSIEIVQKVMRVSD
jgi:dienelactone hydrolase